MDAPQRREGTLSTGETVVVLGAGGFIGRALSARLAAHGVLARTVTRANSGTLSATTDWSQLFDGAHAVVHLANPAKLRPRERHQIDDAVAMAEAINRAAQRCGLTRVIFMSSIKAMSGRSGTTTLRPDATPAPNDDYGRMKLAIETALQGAPGLAVLRPPLVYGPGVKGNFRLLLDAAARGWPLPLAGARNRRAFIFIENLLDIVENLLSPDAPGGVFLIRDDDEVSTAELLRRMALHLGRTPHLLSFPPGLLRLMLTLARRGDAAEALFGSLAVDDSPTRLRLGWQPRVSLDDGLAATCRWFLGTAE